MRILYGVVGEGMGHAMRSRVVLDALCERHEVQVVASGRAYEYLRKRESENVAVQKIWGYSIAYEDNEVKSLRTLLENALGAVTGWPANIRAYLDVIEKFEPEVVVSDFESFSTLFAKNWRLPLLSVDNMQILNRCAHPPEIIEGCEQDFLIAKGVVKSKVPGAYHYFITTFFQAPIRKPRTSLHPPILRPEILAAKPGAGEHLLVYQTQTSNTELPALLARLGVECRIYGLRRDLEEELREGTLRYRPFSEAGFIEDLRTARGVVASAGFTLLGEAVYLQKPVLAIPIAGQFEQTLNARYLEREGFGLAAEVLTGERLGTFLERTSELARNLASYAQDGNRELLDALEETLARAQAGKAPEEDD
jgi:uncharacterized protein (TIGR00661 family)